MALFPKKPNPLSSLALRINVFKLECVILIAGEKMQSYSLDLKAKPFEINAGKHIVIIHSNTARKLGIQPLERIEMFNSETGKSAVTVVDTTDSMLRTGEIGLFREVTSELGVKEGQKLSIRAAGEPESLEFIKKKLRGEALAENEIRSIVRDIGDNMLSDIELSSFMTAVYINGYDLKETVAMTKALTEDGKLLELDAEPIVDKHSIGGVNGRATMLVVPIVAATGLYIPKTSSRSITSAAGTADAMEVLANVNLSMKKIKEITEKIGGVIAWGGSLDLAPVDDKIIKIEHPLSLDPPGQVIASVIAKKASVGSKFVVVDIPIGPGMKVKGREQGALMAEKFISVGRRMGMKVEAVLTDGDQPSGNAFGPALEAKLVLELLEGKQFDDLAQKSCELSGVLLELVGKCNDGRGFDCAKKTLKSGQALKKMKQIISAQGKRVSSSKQVELASNTAEVRIDCEGEIERADVKKLTSIARIAGAPANKKAGVLLNVEMGQKVQKGDLLYTIYAENKRKLSLAERYANRLKPVELEKIILEKIV